ncbi:MAG TPA: hypothetical protein VFQ05_06690 [Candidatus Eisenbacteria bacterium]|nr:hypothetical protein [Candidatus Eisenbacteria bacterium]
MQASQVSEAFARAGQQFSRTPCRECRRSNTYAVIYQGAVVVTCEDCGGATRVGRLPSPR